MTVVMYDSITLSEIPADAPAVAGYVGGRWPTFPQLAVRWPRAHRLSIAVNASQRARCLDIEPGDATPGQAPGWFRSLADSSEGKPVLYSSASTVGPVIATMSAAGIARNRYLIWSAHYTYREHICAPSVCGYPAADATQWTDKALGRNLDRSLCSDQFFAAAPAPAPAAPSRPAAREDLMAVGLLPDGRFETFVQTSSGEVLHRWHDRAGGWVKGWQSLGTPGG